MAAKRRKTSQIPTVVPKESEPPERQGGRVWTFVLIVLVAFLFLAVIVRAATLSMTYDEAYTVSVYAADGSNIFSPGAFLPNNHVLHTLLVWLTFQIAPWSEFGARLPAVLGGLGFILLSVVLGRYLFGTETFRARRDAFLLTALVSLHPLVFQFFSFARGYSLSLFFSLLGFFLLLRLLVSEKERNRPLLFGAGLAFGLSVASNLTAAFMNTSLILTAFLLLFLAGRFRMKAVYDLPLFFCLPGAATVGLFYLPFFLFVPLGRFDYASPTPWSAVLDGTLWSLGNSDVVPTEWKRRILCGIPVSEETFWLAVIVIPFVIGPPLAVSSLVVSTPLWVKSRTAPIKRSRAETALLLVFGGLACYALLLLVAWFFGKTAFPKDRTGIFPVVYLFMLAVLLLHTLKNSGLRKIFLAGCVLVIVQFACNFAFPYNHNFWYADMQIRPMMHRVARIAEESNDPPLLVFAAANEASIDFYLRKYKIDRLETHRILGEKEIPTLAGLPRHLILLLPLETEEPFRKLRLEFRLLQKDRRGILFLADCPRIQEPGPVVPGSDESDSSP